MKKLQVITKPKCPQCEILTNWLKENHADFEVWSVNNEKIKKKLLNDPGFTQTYCDIESCMIYLPAIRVADTGEYYFRDVIDFETFYVLKEILEL